MLDKSPAQHVNDWLYAQTGGVVQSGPFKGMTVPREQGWQDGALCPALLGCHEEELHVAIEHEIERLAELPNPKIVNVGCAEGYYAIGLARRLPKATVWAVDICDESLRIAQQAAADNGVKIVVGATIDDMFASPDLVVMDCEGAEVGYLDPVRWPRLLRATIIVEIHVPPAIIYDRFAKTHFIDVIPEAGRNPNKFPFLHDKPSAFRWMMVSENRPCLMCWFVMRPL